MDSMSRIDIIKFFAKRCGVSYRKASKMYAAMSDMFSHAVKSKSSIRVGKVGVFKPVVSSPKRVVKSFKHGSNGEKLNPMVYNIDHRVKYRFTIFKEFRKNNKM